MSRCMSESHPVGMCGLKHKPGIHLSGSCFVTSRRDVWIETMNASSRLESVEMSHPVGMCGLKLVKNNFLRVRIFVTSRRDVWIETLPLLQLSPTLQSHIP